MTKTEQQSLYAVRHKRINYVAAMEAINYLYLDISLSIRRIIAQVRLAGKLGWTTTI